MTIQTYATIKKTVYVPNQRYAAYSIPHPGRDLKLWIEPNNPWKIVSSKIRLQDKQDSTLWYSVSKAPNLHRYKVGVVLSSREFVWIHGELTKDGQGDGKKTFDVDVPEVDIDISKSNGYPMDENEEETEGGYVAVNGNLKAIYIRKIEPHDRYPNDATVKILYDNKITIWDDMSKTTKIKSGDTIRQDHLPKTVYVEGISPGTTEIKAQYTPPDNGTAEDKVKFTVVKVELEFQNSKMANGKVIDPYTPSADVRIGVIVDDTITFKAKLTPAIALDNSDYIWSGAQPGNGPTITITFASDHNYTEGLSVLGCPNQIANTTATRVPPPNQGTWMALHLPSAVTAFNLGQEAFTWAHENESALGGGIHNGRADAARHCYWNVLMSVYMDTVTAADAGTSHERTNIENGDPHNESVMDLHNNAVGRSISTGLTPNRTECQNAVINALNNGTLWILDNLANNKEIGLLKPSNQ